MVGVCLVMAYDGDKMWIGTSEGIIHVYEASSFNVLFLMLFLIRCFSFTLDGYFF